MKALDTPALIAVSVSLLLWSSTFAGISASLAAYSPEGLALLRFGVASVALAVYAAVTRMPLPRRKDVPQLMMLGALGIAYYHLALNTGQRTVTAGASSMLISSAPAFTAVFASFRLKERLSRWGWLGIGVSFVGVAVIALGEGEGLRFETGALLVLSAAIAISIYSVLQKPWLRRYTALQFTCYSIWSGTLIFAVIAAPGLAAEMRGAPADATLTVIYLGVLPTAVAYVTWSFALSRAPASVVSSFLYLLPTLSVLVAWIWLDEVPTLLSIGGGVTALAGVVLVNMFGKYQERKGATG
jgi:drug/metabolite transporter (DMT)-like permease